MDAELGVAPNTISQLKRGGQRALGIVAVRYGQAEDGHHGIADELLQRATVRGHGLLRDPIEAREEQPQRFRVEVFTQRGRAGDVGEQHGNQAPLFAHLHLPQDIEAEGILGDDPPARMLPD